MTATVNFADYAKHTVKGREMLRAFESAHKVYDYLNAHKGEKFSPKAIAEALYKWGNYQATARELHILEKMGLVGREAYTAVLRVIPNWPYYELVAKVFEGSNFTVELVEDDEEPFVKEVTLYKWYAL